ncbi:glycine cleavage system protein GcvH [Chloroflexota bacterium]
MNPKECKYSKEHEWVCLESENKGKIGISDYAQSQLGDIVFLELPAPGTQLAQFQKMGEIEAVKTVSDIFSLVSGRVMEVNQVAVDEPKMVNDEPYGAGWLIRMELTQPAELDALLSSDEYDKYVAGL